MGNILRFLSHAAPAVAGARRNQLDRRAAAEELTRKRTLEDLLRGQQTERHTAEMESRRLDDLIKQNTISEFGKPKTTPAQRDYDPMRGVIVDKVTGESIVPGNLPERPKADEPLVQVPGPEGRTIYTTRSNAIGKEAPSPTGMGSASVKTKVAANRTMMANIDRAMAAVTANPKAFSITRGLPVVGDRLDPRIDPGGNTARGLVANIGSQKVHDRSGAAVSLHEFPRLAPFIPAVYDPPEKILGNLRQLKLELETETQELERSGTVAPRGSGKSAGVVDPLAIIRKYQLDQE